MKKQEGASALHLAYVSEKVTKVPHYIPNYIHVV